MSAPKFITLNTVHGTPRRFQASHIVDYGVGTNEFSGNTILTTVCGDEYTVTETPEQIDALLGVTVSGGFGRAFGLAMKALRQIAGGDVQNATAAAELAVSIIEQECPAEAAALAAARGEAA